MSRTTAPPVEAPGPASSPAPAPGVGATVALGLAALGSLLVILGLTVGLGPAGWAMGLGCGTVLVAAMARGLGHAGGDTVGPADLVTLSRGVLTCGAAALTAQSLLGHEVTPALLAVAVPALVLDAVDGRVARRTGTVTAFGGRFDGEVDAFLILVLSVHVAPTVGWWVLAAGLARYAFAVAGWVLPWMRGRLEFRYWRKVVTAAVGILLTVAAANVVPHAVTVAAVLVALLLLGESFGRDVRWLWLRRVRRPHGARAVVVANAMALVFVWFALLSPGRPDRLSSSAFLRVPVEALVVLGLALVLPPRWRRALAVVAGALLGGLTVLKLLDLGSFSVLARPFNVVTDRGLLGSGLGFVSDSVGPWAAGGVALVAVLVAGAVVVCAPLAVGRLTRLVARHRRVGARVVAAGAVVWLVAAVSSARLGSGEPVAAADVGRFTAGKVHEVAGAVRDLERFDAALVADAYADPASGDLSALRGKDVVLVFVESYGRVAVEGREAEPVRRLLDSWSARLRASGYAARSAFLTSPTFGGSSWLAHSTLKSGVRVGDQWRYDRLLASSRTTLPSAFGRSGWRTVAVMPSHRRPWPEGQAFYRFETVHDRSGLGYAGPRFGFSAMPDQYALAALERLELAEPHRAPVMAEVDLTSSHGPWAPLPTMVDPAALGDGSVFHGIRKRAGTAEQLWSDHRKVPEAYRVSIAYSLASVISFVGSHDDDDLVVVLLGDHQPSTVVSGFGGNRDVPVSVIAHDPAVIERIAGWGWQDGLRPGESAPVWPMEAFRDRFLAAYSSAPFEPVRDTRAAE